MSQQCDYCEEEYGTDGYHMNISHGFGRGNKEWKQFCSVVCRVWWRRRCSDEPGAWEQPAPKGYQGRLDRFRDDTDDRSESVTAAVEASPTDRSRSWSRRRTTTRRRRSGHRQAFRGPSADATSEQSRRNRRSQRHSYAL